MAAFAKPTTLAHCATNPSVCLNAPKEKELASLHIPTRLSPFASATMDGKELHAMIVFRIQDVQEELLVLQAVAWNPTSAFAYPPTRVLSVTFT